MSNFKHFLPVPHWSKPFFKAHKIPFSAVARALNLSYNYTCNLLSGVSTLTPANEAKLKALVKQLGGASHE